MIPLSLFLALLGVGMYTDIRARRVPNALVLLLLVWAGIGGAAHWSPAATVGSALLGGTVGLALWLPFWFLGLLGAGDVKFFAAGAAWIGAPLAWRAAAVTALIGGLLAVVVLVWQRGLRRTAMEVVVQYQQASLIIAAADTGGSAAAARTFPYAVPMALALGAAAIRPEVMRQW